MPTIYSCWMWRALNSRVSTILQRSRNYPIYVASSYLSGFTTAGRGLSTSKHYHKRAVEATTRTGCTDSINSSFFTRYMGLGWKFSSRVRYKTPGERQGLYTKSCALLAQLAYHQLSSVRRPYPQLLRLFKGSKANVELCRVLQREARQNCSCSSAPTPPKRWAASSQKLWRPHCSLSSHRS
ncbi:hypothetical protein GQ44DRAFT_714404 [Phaeosphaeriaceae sp. PMI808]|nr:hypothetical protein GQ44DRAFT_714404 [Phaeosphaeriaceae sp. PMI808]